MDDVQILCFWCIFRRASINGYDILCQSFWPLFPASCFRETRTMSFVETKPDIQITQTSSNTYTYYHQFAYVFQIANNKITYGDHSNWITFTKCSNKHHMCRISQFSWKVIQTDVVSFSFYFTLLFFFRTVCDLHLSWQIFAHFHVSNHIWCTYSSDINNGRSFFSIYGSRL